MRSACRYREQLPDSPGLCLPDHPTMMFEASGSVCAVAHINQMACLLVLQCRDKNCRKPLVFQAFNLALVVERHQSLVDSRDFLVTQQGRHSRT